MALKLELSKDGTGPKLKLDLTKPSRFVVELLWDSTQDLDTHALLALNAGAGAKVSDFARVLSTFNPHLPLADGSAPSRKSGDKRPFKTPEGSLTHSGDARSGVGSDIDEFITVDGALIPDGVNEIPIFVTIFDPNGTFRDVKKAGIRIKDGSGKVLGEYELSNQFAQFNAVQLGSLLLSDKGWEYMAAGSGFMGDFNTVLEHFS